MKFNKNEFGWKEKVNINSDELVTKNDVPHYNEILITEISGDDYRFFRNNNYFNMSALNIDETKYKTLLTEDMKVDILSGISQKEFIAKYNVCKKTFINYRKKLNPTYKREYKTKVNLDIFREYLSCHSIKECATHFNISIDLAYKYKARLREKVFN